MKQNEYDQLKSQVWDEIDKDSEVISAEIFSPTLPDSKKLSHPAFMQMAMRNWGDVQFRQGLLQQMGPESFLKLHDELAKGLPEVNSGQ